MKYVEKSQIAALKLLMDESRELKAQAVKAATLTEKAELLRRAARLRDMAYVVGEVE